MAMHETFVTLKQLFKPLEHSIRKRYSAHIQRWSPKYKLNHHYTQVSADVDGPVRCTEHLMNYCVKCLSQRSFRLKLY